MTPTTALTDITYCTIESPIGDLHLTFASSALSGLFVSNHPAVSRMTPKDEGSPLKDEVARQLDEYWRGTLRKFSIPLAPVGTPWQMRVWDELRKVPFGDTVTYAQLAHRLDAPRSARAVGSANARNPISVLIPCHRVVSSKGALTGYAGGLNRKQWLLEHESNAV